MFGFWTNITQNQIDSINHRLDQLEKTQQLILKNQVLMDKNNKLRTDKLDRLLNAVLLRLGPKAEFRFDNVEELEMSKFKVDIVLPPPAAPDVAKGGKREVVITSLAGVETLLLDGDVAVISDLVFSQDESVRADLTDIDDAGNRSPVSSAVVVVVDKVAPPQPGQIGFVVKEEIFEDEPVVDEPVVLPPVAEVPVVEEPVAEVPVVEEPVIEAPVEPVAEVTSDTEIQPE